VLNLSQVFAIEGLVPVIDPSAYVHPTAVLIGDVIIGPDCYVGPAACMRGDFGRLILEQGANLQDTCVMHGFPGTDTRVSAYGHIGHGAVLHGCQVGRNAMVGMNAVVMDNAQIGEESIVAALALVKAEMIIPARSLVAGIPGKVVRVLTADEIRWKTEGTEIYQALAVRSRLSLRKATPLTEVEPDRKRISAAAVKPLNEARLDFDTGITQEP
jgi:phenylacetic acid degradation protein